MERIVIGLLPRAFSERAKLLGVVGVLREGVVAPCRGRGAFGGGLNRKSASAGQEHKRYRKPGLELGHVTFLLRVLRLTWPDYSLVAPGRDPVQTRLIRASRQKVSTGRTEYGITFDFSGIYSCGRPVLSARAFADWR